MTPTPPVSQPPVVPTPSAPQPPSTPAPVPPTISADRFDPNHDLAHAANLGTITQTVVSGLTLDQAGQLDVFTFRAAKVGTVKLFNTSAYTMVINEQGQLVASGTGTLSFKATRAGSKFIVVVKSTDGAPVANYAIGIVIQPAMLPSRVVARRRASPHHQSVAPVHALGRVSTQNQWGHDRIVLGTTHRTAKLVN